MPINTQSNQEAENNTPVQAMNNDGMSLNPLATNGLNQHSKILFPELATVLTIAAASNVDINTPLNTNKRKAKGKTPIVDDEVRRSSRFRKEVAAAHVQLNN